ncbi:MAG TPA: glycosyltransferase family 2 protein [Pyrinomonadaceae bacterium]|nr:glycosyltransferase family 2 protein [Pyrinomonadaceae bacterium]
MSSTTRETETKTRTTRAAATTTATAGESRLTRTDAGGQPAHAPLLAIVVPCLNEELVVGTTARRLVEVLRHLSAAGKIDAESFVYFVDDGSIDATWAVIEELHREDASVKGLKLARNVGTQNALLAGLLSVKEHADCVVTIDADLQQDEQVIETFLEKYAAGAHIVYGVRKGRGDSLLKKATSSFFYNSMTLMGAKIIKHHSEYRLVSRKAIEAISEYREYNLFLRGIFVDIGYKSEIVPFTVRRRGAGQSKHNFRKLVSLALDGITSFSVVPLRLVTVAGLLVFLFSVLMTLFYLYHKIRGHTPPGWAGTIIPIYFLGGVQIMFLGIVGEYIGKIYQEAKARPRYIKDTELF